MIFTPNFPISCIHICSVYVMVVYKISKILGVASVINLCHCSNPFTLLLLFESKKENLFLLELSFSNYFSSKANLRLYF